MTDDGPDPNDVRRHAKKMHTEREYRLKYCSIDFYRPNRKQMAFHSLDARETMLRAGNQLGKCVTYQTLIDHPDGTSTPAGVLYERGVHFLVRSWSCISGLRFGSAAGLIKKPAEPCVRIWMLRGGWFECAMNHRVLCRDGEYRFVGRLLPSVPCLPASSLERARSVRAADDRPALLSPGFDEGDRIIAYMPIGSQEVYDFTVPVFHNYLAGGVIHHNTHAVGAQMTFDALGIYPDWYVGWRIGKPPAISRSVDFMGWATCTTSATTRDGVQTKLFGDITQEGGLGTGLVPLDHIGKVGMARGISGFIDTVSINRIVGGVASVRLKTYEMGREAFQAVPVDRLWLDEDTKDPDIYGECLARLTTTRGRIYTSMTPMRGLTPMRRRFKSRTEGTEEVLMTIYDAAVSNDGHIPDGDIPGIIAGMSDAERQTRAFGADMQGEGAVFETPIDRITYSQDPSTFPPYWRWLWAFDFRHSGSETTGHPFAAVLGCRDLDTDTIYVVHALRMKGLAPMHVAAIKSHPMREAPVAWPHDGGRGASLISGETVMQVYRRLGMNMLPTHATFAGGGYNFEAGIDDMRIRFSSGRLKIAAHLSEVLDEYQGYHLVNGLVNKIDDDLLSAIRVLCMDIRRSKAMNEFSGFSTRRREGRTQLAAGVDFDVFTGGPA